MIWSVVVKREKADGAVVERTFKVKHVIFAVGWGGGTPNVPSYPGAVRSYRHPFGETVLLMMMRQDTFAGQILHSSQHKSARDHIGKKVVVVGACTSGRFTWRMLRNGRADGTYLLPLGHDLCADYHKHGVGTVFSSTRWVCLFALRLVSSDITMYQRSPTYIMSAKHGLRILLGGICPFTSSAPSFANSTDALRLVLGGRTTNGNRGHPQRVLPQPPHVPPAQADDGGHR